MRCESKGGAIMGKETVKNTYVLQEDENIGTVQIADEVVAIIASLAATEANRKKEMYCCVRYNKQNARKDSVLPVIFSCVRGGSCPHIMKPSFSCHYACHARLISFLLLKLISSTFREHPFSRRSAPL